MQRLIRPLFALGLLIAAAAPAAALEDRNDRLERGRTAAADAAPATDAAAYRDQIRARIETLTRRVEQLEANESNPRALRRAQRELQNMKGYLRQIRQLPAASRAALPSGNLPAEYLREMRPFLQQSVDGFYRHGQRYSGWQEWMRSNSPATVEPTPEVVRESEPTRRERPRRWRLRRDSADDRTAIDRDVQQLLDRIPGGAIR